MIKGLKVFLVGMPLCGKSTIGKVVAKKLNFKIIDLDTEIIKSENQTINKIFELNGEKYFREIETQLLDSIINKNKSFIMATGGGTPCFNNNINLINKSGISIYIDTPIKKLEKRLINENERPLLKNNPIQRKVFDKLYNERKIYYEKSKFKVSEDNNTVEAIISIIKKFES